MASSTVDTEMSMTVLMVVSEFSFKYGAGTGVGTTSITGCRAQKSRVSYESDKKSL